MADPSAYADAMSGVFANPQFLEMAEKLGQQLMQVGGVQHRRCRCGHLLLQIIQGLWSSACQAVVIGQPFSLQ